MASIRSLELPKGCMKVVAYLKESQPANISDITRSTGLSQSGIYSSLERLKRLDMVSSIEKAQIQGRPSVCLLTDWGNRLGNCVLAVFDTFREISGKSDIDAYTTLPVGSFSVLVHTYKKGSTTLTEAISELGLCKATASSAFGGLTRLRLIHPRKKKRFRRTTKQYKLTKEGEYLTRLLDIIDVALRWKGASEVTARTFSEKKRESG